MRIDEALAESKPLAVKFGAAVLNIQYRPPSFTIEEMVAADADKENPERLIEMLQSLIQGWDLTRLEKVPYDPETTAGPFEREVPVDITNPEDVRKYVPNNIIMGIVRAVRADNDPSGE
jgi:hypothetical protein